MPSVTFLGEIRRGQIHTDQPLADFEGEKVSVTVIAPDTAATADASETPAHPPEPTFDPEEPVLHEDLGRLRVPPRDVRTLNARLVDGGRVAPRVYPSDEEA